MSKLLLTELFEKPDTEFLSHISDPQNARILFSGKFGMGKTTYINHFFDGKKNEFVKIHLFPVNYSIASNEDIIDLIRYDILMELIREGVDFEVKEIPLQDKLYGFSQANALEIVKRIIHCIPKTGKDISASIKGFQELYNSFLGYCEQISEDEGKEVLEFIEKIQKEKGSIYEQTIITRLICDKIKQIKESNRQVALIIDDLDRIDPDHIFRLFNVFAAQFDSSNENSLSNKFGFDKVIFVCDIDNIRSIFKHKYGADTDFGGYIDKFYSKEIYAFDNVYNYDEITTTLTNIIVRNCTSINGSQNSESIKNIISIFIKICVEQRLVNLRTLCRYIDQNIIIKNTKKVWVAQNNIEINIDFDIIVATLIIRKMFGNDDELEILLRKNKNRIDVNGCLSDLNYILNQNTGIPINLYQNKVFTTQYPLHIYIDEKLITINEKTENLVPKINNHKINSFAVFYEVLKFIKDLEANDYIIFANSPSYQPSVN